ncbi:hypothetical protein BDZ90DRAFT_223231 [Jaminaea rosea]|uniref:25S rRNA adenine-N(1) methyltransferase n=1 Tax=Jaminaea rosea TaxID=1569628 RepID=A0A316UJJ6_9BASI|nr:hypothetical protein BDZ90DRAFT_223231 [Jaminaea rosea]PWN25457.1 hypothetical protein BDZ90DRAFT_223231 [Jaminaea rosea]
MTSTTSEPAVEQLAKKKGKLIRPRGKRGGKKHQSKAALAAAAEVVKAAKKKAARGPSEHSIRIAHFHCLEKEKARLISGKGSDQGQSAELRLAEIEREQAELGGLDAYQDDSLAGSASHRGGESGKWLVQQVIKLRGKETVSLRLLDVGALTGTSYSSYSFINPTYIDINPRASHVIQNDFFDFPLPAQSEEKYDIVCLSLVLNFVGDLAKRGEALVRAHGYLKPEGMLYLVLPLACVANSRYLDHGRLQAILESCGWDVLVNDDSARLTRWLLKRKEEVKGGSKARGGPCWDGTQWKKEEIKVSKTANNFCIKVDQPEQPPKRPAKRAK